MKTEKTLGEDFKLQDPNNGEEVPTKLRIDTCDWTYKHLIKSKQRQHRNAAIESLAKGIQLRMIKIKNDHCL